MTHNAMSSTDDVFGIPNQTHGITRQLTDGIRGMMLDIHYFSVDENKNVDEREPNVSALDQVYLCHTSCTFGKTRLFDGMCLLSRFLDEHPGEIVSIIFETYVSDADTDA